MGRGSRSSGNPLSKPSHHRAHASLASMPAVGIARLIIYRDGVPEFRRHNTTLRVPELEFR